MPAQTTTTTIRDVKIRLHRAGRGMPVLFLHGAGGVPVWLPFFDAIADGYELLVPEHPGFGGSDDPAWIRNIPDLAMFYLEFLEEMGIEKYHLIGNSLGGWAAAEMLVRDRTRCQSLTLLAPAGIRIKDMPGGDLFIWNPEETIRNIYYDQAIAERSREQEQIKQQIAVFQERIQSSPAVEQEYKALTRDYQTALEFYNDLLKKRDQSAMASDLEQRQQGEQFRVLDPANLPDQPSFPNRPLFAAGGLVGGLGLGLGLAFLLEMRDSSLRTERDVEFSLHLPVIAMIPAIEPLTGKKSKETAELPTAGRGFGLSART